MIVENLLKKLQILLKNNSKNTFKNMDLDTKKEKCQSALEYARDEIQCMVDNCQLTLDKLEDCLYIINELDILISEIQNI